MTENLRDQVYGLAFMAGVVCGGMIFVGLYAKFNDGSGTLKDMSVQYSDLISIVLTAVTVVLAALALGIGFLTIWGYSQFKEMTRAASEENLRKLLNDGPFSEKINKIIVAHVTDQLQKGELRSILLEKIDSLSMSDAEHRSVVQEEEGKPFRD